MSFPSNCLVFRSGWDPRTLKYEPEPPEQLRTALDSKVYASIHIQSCVFIINQEENQGYISCNVSPSLVIGSFCNGIGLGVRTLSSVHELWIGPSHRTDV